MNRFNISGKIGSAGVNHLPKSEISNEPIRNGTKEVSQDIEETVFRPKKEKRKKLKFQRDE
jgi:hypothetical protein